MLTDDDATGSSRPTSRSTSTARAPSPDQPTSATTLARTGSSNHTGDLMKSGVVLLAFGGAAVRISRKRRTSAPPPPSSRPGLQLSDIGASGRRRRVLGSDPWPTSRTAPRSRTTWSRTARSRRRTAFEAGRASSLGPFLYDEADADWQGFWARQAAELLDWFEAWHTDPRVGPAVRQVVRRRQAQRLPQRRRPPRRRRPGRQGRVPLGGRARRHPHHHLRRPARRGAAASPTSSRASASARATASASTCRWSPSCPIAMLACARIGAAHSVVFGGFSPDSPHRPHQRRRVQGRHHRRRRLPPRRAVDAQAERRRRRSRPPRAIEHVVVVQAGRRAGRHGRGPRPLVARRSWPSADAECPCEPMDSEDLLYLLYTSGTTAKPKGIMHTTGGYLTQVAFTHKYVFDLHPDDRRLLVRRRHRLGHRPQLHRLRPAHQRRHVGDVRGHARHARARTGSGTSPSATASRSSTPRPPPSARS